MWRVRQAARFVSRLQLPVDVWASPGRVPPGQDRGRLHSDDGPDPDAGDGSLARIAKFSVGDFVKVTSRFATYRTYGIIGIVEKVNEQTIHIGPPGTRYRGEQYRWVSSYLTPFQKIKGFNARIDHCEHHTR